jgi:hypothetical protein
MTGPEHYRKAENLVATAQNHGYGDEHCRDILAAAQVHATLAIAAATAGKTAVDAFRDDINSIDVEEWADALAATGGTPDA